ncbi:MAG TPA: hypothetical protein VKU41_23755, partial [Polyangiaceae bacterium]|nr:hypothetical protein [Polyangiaceae bacterium]
MMPSSRRSGRASWTCALVVAALAVVAACGGSTQGGVAPDGGLSNPFGGGGLAGNGAGGSAPWGGGGGGGSACIAGTQGCLCDSSGGCAPGLTCAAQAGQASVCCSGSNCASSGGGVGASCGTVNGGAACTPGITILSASGNNDGCGYPASSFVESTTLCAINAVGGGAQPAIIQVFYNDEHALTLGCATSADPVSALPADPGAVSYPQTGDPACVDAVGRPLRPVLYVTDISADPTCTSGDQQHGGQPYNPIAVFGTWKSATEGAGNVGTPATMDPTANKWDLGPMADTPPATATGAATTGGAAPGAPKPGMGPGMPAGGPMGCNEGYGAELRFEVGLLSGHSYRFQVIVHDGDQNKGG